MPPSGPAAGATPSYFSRWIRPRSSPSYSPNETARSNPGSESRQFGQRPSPISNWALARRSPQTTHCGARTGSISPRHSRHTGRREMLSRGVWQSLQSEGNRMPKTLSSKVCKGATRIARCGARGSRRVRLSVSRLLKMTLQPSHGARGTHEDPCLGTTGPNQRWLTPIGPKAP